MKQIPHSKGWEIPYRNSGFFFVGLIVLILAGFSKSYFLKLNEQFPTAIHLHAVFMSAWCLLITTQAFLIRFKRGEWHRALGKISFVLAPLILISGIYLAEMRFAGRVDTVDLAANLRGLFLPLSHFILFGFLYVLSIAYRKQSQYHARYMIAATLLLVPPALVRVLGNWAPPVPGMSFLTVSFIVTDLLLVGLIVFDKWKGQLRSPFLVALPLFVAIQVLREYAGASAWWRWIAGWFVNFGT